MSIAYVLTGDVLTAHGHLVLAAGDDLAPSESAGVNLNLSLWSGIASFVAPLLVAVVQQPRWAPAVRAIVTALICLGMAWATVVLEGKLTGARWTTATLLVLSGAVFWYQTIWKTVAPRLEVATSSGGRHRAPE